MERGQPVTSSRRKAPTESTLLVEPPAPDKEVAASSGWGYAPLVAIVCLSNFASNFTFSMVMGFLPIEGDKRGIQAFGLGAISAAQKGGTLLSVWWVSSLCQRFGNAQVLIVSNTLHAAAVLVNGIIGYRIDTASHFTLLFIISRLTQGATNALADGAAMGMMIRGVPKRRLQSALGMTEGVRALSLSVGPVVGSNLYSAGRGMLLPYSVSAALIMLTPVTVLSVYVFSPSLREVISNAGAKDRKLGSIFTLLRIPAFSTLVVVQWLLLSPIGFWEGTLSSVWAQPPLSMSHGDIGASITLGAAAGPVAALALGALGKWTRHINILLGLLAAAALLMAAGAFLIGELPASLKAQIAGFTMSGAACGVFLVGGPSAMAKITMSDLVRAAAADEATGASPPADEAAVAAAQKASEQDQEERAENLATILMTNFSVGLVSGSLCLSGLTNAIGFDQANIVTGFVTSALIVPLGAVAWCLRDMKE